MLSFVAGLTAGPLFGLDATAAPDAIAAPAAIGSVSPTASQSEAAAEPSGSTSSPVKRVDPLACFKVKDTRQAAELSTPFKVCGVPLINSNHKVSADFKPKLDDIDLPTYGLSQVELQPKAGAALTKMFTAAEAAGISLRVRYAHRSYEVQTRMYATGSKALTAEPGASEHQSGLAVDLAALENGALVRGTALASSPSGRWLAQHSREFGFILRYPPNQSQITGISYEPWHFRYVGKSVAKGVRRTDSQTLEEYLQQK